MVKKSVFGVIILSVAFIAGCNNEDSSRSHITESKAEQLLSLLNENPSKEGLEKLKSLVVPLNEGIKNNEEIAIVLPIDISSDTLTEIECLGEEMLGAAGDYVDDYIAYLKKVTLPVYNINIQYMSPKTCEYDKEHANRITGGNINPQGRPSTSFPERIDFKEFGPCFFSPITVYQLKGSLEEAVAYFEAQDAITYTKLSEMGEDTGYWSRRWGTTHIRGKHISKGITDGTVIFYKRDGPIDWKTFPINGIRQRYIIYNTKTPNRLYKIDARGDDCGGHPDISVIDFIE